MKKGTLGYCIIAGVLIIGCAVFFIGRNIKNNNEEQNKEEIKNTLVNISDAYDVDELLASEYDNIELPSSLNVDEVDTVSNVILKVPDYEEQNKKIDIKFFQDNLKKLGYEYDEKCVVDDKGKTYPYGKYYMQEEPYIYISTGCTGFFSVDSIGTHDYEVVEEFYANAPYEDKEYELVGGPMKVSGAINTFEQLETEYIAELNYDIPVPKVFRVRLVKDENQQLRYELDAQMSYKGIDTFYINDTYKRSGIKYESSLGASGLISGENVANGISVTLSGFPTECVSEEQIDKVISIKDATDIINQKLAEYKKNKLVNVKMEYLSFFEERTYEERHMTAEWTEICSGNKFRLKPYWVFVFDSTTNSEIIGLVDCVTGEVGLVYNQ